MRPQLNKACFHVSIGLPPGEGLEDEKWEEFATEYMQRMGFKNAPWLAVKHDDTEHKHIHIVALRIDSEGKSITDSKDYERGAVILQDFEQRWNLTPGAKTPKQAYEAGNRGVSFAEMGKYKRTGEVPEKLKIREIVKSALAGKPSVPEFAERLDMAGVSMLPNISPKSGHVSGISFALNGVAVKGSSLGKLFSWAGLQKQGLVWDKQKDKDLLVNIREANANEHNDAVKITNKRTDTNSKTSSKTAPTAPTAKPGNSKSDSETDIKFGSGDRTANTNYVEFNTRNDISNNEIQQSNDEFKNEDGQSSKSNTNSNNEKSKRPQFNIRGDKKDDKNDGSDDTKTSQDSSEQEQKSVDFNSVFDAFGGDNAWSRIVLLGAGKLFKLQNNEFKPRASCGVSTAGLESVKPHLQQKIKAFRQQHNALQAPKYRITLVSTSNDKSGFNLGKQKEKNERFFTAKEVEDKIAFLAGKNAQGYNIYITPISENEHYCVLDDTTMDGVNALYKKTGITPCLCQESSPGNWQAIYRIQGPSEKSIWDTDERSIGNKIVQTLNQNYGDKKFSGVTHPFRLAGFANRKEKYNKGGKYPFVSVIHCKPGIDPVLSSWFKNARLENEKRKQEKEYIKEQEQMEKQKQKRYENITNNAMDYGNISGDYDKIYARHFKSVEKTVKNMGWQENLSAIDFRVAKQMLAQNISKNDVAQAILNNSPNLTNRHVNANDYISRTVDKASLEVQQQRRARSGGPGNDRRM
jgi:hypothetical protein